MQLSNVASPIVGEVEIHYNRQVILQIVNIPCSYTEHPTKYIHRPTCSVLLVLKCRQQCKANRIVCLFHWVFPILPDRFYDEGREMNSTRSADWLGPKTPRKCCWPFAEIHTICRCYLVSRLTPESFRDRLLQRYQIPVLGNELPRNFKHHYSRKNL